MPARGCREPNRRKRAQPAWKTKLPWMWAVFVSSVMFGVIVAFMCTIKHLAGQTGAYQRPIPPLMPFTPRDDAEARRKDVDAIVAKEAWRAQNLAPFDQANTDMQAQCKEPITEGNSATLIFERQIYASIASRPWVKTICEIGFNGGHSAGLWLKANPTAKVVMFDLWKHTYAPCAFGYLSKTYPGRITLHKGNSALTVPAFHAANPDFKCDIISVDGGHQISQAVLDITNMKQLADPEFSVLFVDDTNCHAPYCVDAAIQHHKRAGTLKILLGVTERNGRRGLTVMEYLRETHYQTGAKDGHSMGIEDAEARREDVDAGAGRRRA